MRTGWAKAKIRHSKLRELSSSSRLFWGETRLAQRTDVRDWVLKLHWRCCLIMIVKIVIHQRDMQVLSMGWANCNNVADTRGDLLLIRGKGSCNYHQGGIVIASQCNWCPPRFDFAGGISAVGGAICQAQIERLACGITMS
jgi:hypothetical protein